MVARGTLLLITLALLTLGLAGCVDEEAPKAAADADDAEDEGPAPISLQAGTGTIAGQVVNDGLEPVGGAAVVIQELEQNTTADGQGHYQLNGIEPGTYTVFAQAEKHKVQRVEVEVVADRVRDVGFILERLPTDSPHVVVLEQAGFLECQTGAVVLTMNCLPIQFVLQEVGVNPTNTVSILEWDAEVEGLEAAIVEMVWTPPASGVFARELQLLVESASTDITEGQSYGSSQGPSPVRVELIGEDAPVQDENATMTEFQTRVFPPFEPGHVVFQQKYTVFVSLFYHQLPVPGYTAVPDGFQG